MLGKQVYFCDLKDDVVKIGKVYNITANQAGYMVYNVICDGKRQSVDECLVYESEDKALAKLSQSLPIKKEMETIQNETNKKLDDLRELIVGKPQFKELSDEIYK